MESKRKKPFYKRWKFWAGTFAVIFVISLFAPEEDIAPKKDVTAEDRPKKVEVIKEKSPEEIAVEKAKLERKAAEAKAEEEQWLAESAEKAKEAEAEKKEEKVADTSRRAIDTSVFEYAENIEVTDAIDLNEHITVIITMKSATDPGMATQHVVNQTYDFIQQADVKGAKTIGINVKQGDSKIAQYTVYTDKFVSNDDIPMSDLVMAASEIEFMTDEVKEFGKVIGSW